MGIATFCSRIAGLVREQVFAHWFGAGHAMDAFNIAFRIPNLLRDLFAEGAMSAALVPTFTAVQEKEGEARSWLLAGRVFRVLFIFVSLLSVLGILFAEPLVDLYAHKYREVSGKFELTVTLTRILFFFFPFVALAAAYMGVLNSCRKFFWPAFASALFNVTSIITGCILAWVFERNSVEPMLGMAIGVVLGGAVQAFCQLPILYKVGYQKVRGVWSGWRDDPALKQMLALMIPGMVGLAATQINVLINSILATGHGAGAVSWLNYSFRLMQFPIGIFGVSLASATVPKVTREWVKLDFTQALRTLKSSLKLVFAINLPASAGLAFLAIPIISLLFEHGRFTHSDTLEAAKALGAYSLGLTGYSVVKVLVPVCYAFGSPRIPVISSVVSVGVSIGLSFWFGELFGFWGLALATSAGAFLNAVILLVSIGAVFSKKGLVFGFFDLLMSFLNYLFLALVVGGVCIMTHNAFGQEDGGIFTRSLWARSLWMCILVAEGVVVWVVIGRFFGLPEMKQVVEILSKKLKSRLG